MKASCVCEILWKRLLVLAVAAFVVIYLLATTALYFWWDRVPGNQVTWLDVALGPVRSEQLRKKRGDSAIDAALMRLRERDSVEAYYGLRVGLARSPGNAAGRVALARLTIGGDPQGALKLLEDGLAHSPGDLELLRTLFAVYAAQQARVAALATSERLLAPAQQPPLTPAARAWLTQTRAALLLAGREPADVEQALSILQDAADTNDEGRTRYLRFTALVQLGRFDEARRQLDAMPTNGAERWRAAADLALATGDAAALESALTRLKAAAPDQPMPLIFAFNAWHQMKRLTLRDRAEAEFFNFFGASDGALQLLAATAVNLELPDVVRRTEQVALAHRLSPFAFRVHLTELALRRGDVNEAFRRLREWEPTIETLAPMQRFYPEFIRRLARASVAGAEPQGGGLVNHLAELRGRATVGMYELAAKVLARAGNVAGGRDVVELGL
jgi:tetratricopeptide (TPR) repeat protein